MRALGISTVLTVGLLLVLPGTAGPAELEGRLTNKTPGGRGVGNVEVTLTFSKTGQEEKQRTRTDGRGTFRFADLAPGTRYELSLTFQGAEYTLAVGFKPGEEKQSIEVPVYDATDDPSALRVKEHHLMLEGGEGSLLVKEFLLVENVGNKAFVGARPVDGGRRATLQFTLQRGAAELQYLSGLMECCVVPTASGFVDTMDVKPGVREIGFTYTLKPDSDRYAYARLLDYPSQGVNAFVSGAESATSSSLETREAVQLEGRRYLHLSGKDLPRGALVKLELGGLPNQSASLRYLILGATVLLVGAALAYPVVRRSGPRPAERATRREATEALSDEGVTSRETMGARYDELVEAIARLDDAFEAGRINREEYDRLRAERKQALLQTAEKLRGSSRVE